MKYADYIQQIEIDALWDNQKHIVWQLDQQVNILSGINGVGKTTILNKVLKAIDANGKLKNAEPREVHIKPMPKDAEGLRFDIIRSFDKPLIAADAVLHLERSVVTELDRQLFQLQRKYLDYQVNIGNRMIATLQEGGDTSAAKAQKLAMPKKRFQDIIDTLFAETGKKIVRSENEIRFSTGKRLLTPYELSSGEKQILAILLTVLVQDGLPYVLFMDEPEVSLHVDWQQQLIDLILQLNPRVQVILTTHSPAVIMNGWIDKVTEVNDISN